VNLFFDWCCSRPTLFTVWRGCIVGNDAKNHGQLATAAFKPDPTAMRLTIFPLFDTAMCDNLS
jgi:hypothetical protein